MSDASWPDPASVRDDWTETENAVTDDTGDVDPIIAGFNGFGAGVKALLDSATGALAKTGDTVTGPLTAVNTTLGRKRTADTDDRSRLGVTPLGEEAFEMGDGTTDTTKKSWLARQAVDIWRLGPASLSTSLLFPPNGYTANHTFGDVDRGCVAQASGAGDLFFTIPSNSLWNPPIGTRLAVANIGTGTVTIAPASGVALNTSMPVTIDKRFAELMLRKTGTNSWSIQWGSHGIDPADIPELSAGTGILFQTTGNVTTIAATSDIVAAGPAAATGWLNAISWTRTADTQFTVPADQTGVYQPGTKLRFTDGGVVKYGVVRSSSFSTVTSVNLIPSNTGMAMAASPTAMAYSYASLPQGWPETFSWTPTITGFSAAPTNQNNRWRADGRIMTLFIDHRTAGTSNATTYTVSLPVAAATITSMQWRGLCGRAFNNGARTGPPAEWIIDSAGTVVTFNVGNGFDAWAAANGKSVSGIITYQY